MEWDASIFRELEVELWMFAHHDWEDEGFNNGSRDRFYHYKRAVDMLWNLDDRSTRRVIWNEWSEEMGRGMCDNKYLSLAGSASSGKSDAMAVYGIVSYLAAPQTTKVVMTSTSIKMAHMRIWRSVNELWRDDFPGKMVYSKALVKGYDLKGVLGETSGIALIPAAGGSGEEIDSNFLGLKQDRMIVLLDELSEMPVSVLAGCYSNLSNNTYFEMKAASNPNHYHDAFGLFSKPKAGWASVSESDLSWETSRGMCMRFDAEQSPNIIAGDNKYPWLPKKANIDAAKRDYGERSRFFFRMYKAFWFSGASDETIYSEGEIVDSGADTAVDDSELDKFQEDPVKGIGLDVGFTLGGDRSVAVKGRIVIIGGKSVMEVLDVEVIKDSIDSDDSSRSYSVVKHCRSRCEKEGIVPGNFAFDMTGAGIPFRDIVVSEWSSMPMGVKFGGKASGMQISAIDKRKGHEVYYNRVSELWVRMKGLMREGRIRGLTSEIVSELIERQWHDQNGRLLRVESKVDMKKRVGKSSDICDALFILLELFIARGYMGEMESVNIDSRASEVWAKSAAIQNIDVWADLDLDW